MLLKLKFFKAVAMSVLLYGFTTWTATKCLEKKIDRNYTRSLCAVLNTESSTSQNGQLLPISQTIQIRWTKLVGYCWRSRDKLISEVLPRIYTHVHTGVERPTKTSALCEHWMLPRRAARSEEWSGQMVSRGSRELYASSMTSWWGWYMMPISFANGPRCNIMAEGFRLMPLGLVRLRTFGLLRCNINTGVRVRAEQTCHSEMSQ